MFSISQRLAVRERTKLAAQTFETLLDLDGRPHLAVAIRVSGAIFPQLDSEPFVQLVNERGQGVRSWTAEVAEDGSSITGYYPLDARFSGTIVEFGYGAAVFGRIGSYKVAADALDRERLPERTVQLSTELIRKISKLKPKQDPLAVAAS